MNCNTIFFLLPSEIERASFETQLKRYKAYQAIDNDKTQALSDEQRKEIRAELKKLEGDLKEALRRLYRQIATPTRDSYKKDDLGIPTYGVQKSIDEEVYDKLKSNNEIIEQLVPLVIKERYLGKNEFVSTQQILQAGYRTPGEPRITDKGVLERAILDGVEKGIFGLGELENNQPILRYFKEKAKVGFSESEIIINETVCKELKEKRCEDKVFGGTSGIAKEKGESDSITKGEEKKEESAIKKSQETLEHVNLLFNIPKGKVADVSRILNFLQMKFETLTIEIKASNGAIPKQDYENKIKESLRQLGIDIE